MGISIMCLFKDLQEEVYPGVHPHADISWDLEFMGTRSNFLTLVSFYTSSHPAATLTLPLLIIFDSMPPPPVLTATLFLSPPSKSPSGHFSYTSGRLDDLSAALFCPRLLSPESA